MLSAFLLAAVTIAFPQEGQRLPSLSRCYVIGAADGCETNLPVRISRTGAWGMVVDVKPGANTVCVGGTKRSFVVGSLGSVGSLKSVGSTGSLGSAVSAGALASAGEKKVYGKLEYASEEAKPHPSGKKPDEVTVVLDAGHGGADSGATSPHGLPESDANLRLARAVEAALKKRGFRVVQTRTDDVAVALYDRPKVAHAAGADAFVSLHYNAPGYETDPTTCRWQAVYAWNPLGERLAEAVSARMAAAHPSLPSRGVQRANFAVTRNPEIPSCLVEADFITHPEGELAAWDAARRETLAAAIADGLVDWLNGR